MSYDPIEREIRRYIAGISGGMICEDALRDFLKKLPGAVKVTDIGLYMNDKGIGVIKVSYSGNPIQGVKKWCVAKDEVEKST